MKEIDFQSDDFSDVIAKDSRFNARAYALLLDVLRYLSGDGDRRFSGEDILEEFKESTLDQYGPLSYRVLTEWGLSCTEDIGEMIFNLVDAGRIGREASDTSDAFADGYDFKETFLDPYQT